MPLPGIRVTRVSCGGPGTVAAPRDLGPGLARARVGDRHVMTDPSTPGTGGDRRTTTPEGRDADAPSDDGSPDLPEFGHDGPEHYPTEQDPS